jgi:hypothetical protein
MVKTYSLPAGLALLVFPWVVAAQAQPDLSAILERLDHLERENRSLTDEVQSLRARLDAVAPASSAAAPPASAALLPAPAGAPPASVAASADTRPEARLSIPDRLDMDERRIDEQAQTKVESSQKFPIRITGMALFNAYMNSRQSAGQQYPVTASASGPRGTGATLRQTIVGLEYRGPDSVGGGKVRGSVYMDFFPTAAGTVGSNQVMRIRTGSIEIDWKDRSIMVGLEKPIFNPREPSSLALVGVSPLTGSGNLWLWLPQARFEQDLRLGTATGIRAQLGVVQTRETGPYAGSEFTGTVETARPGYEGRFEFFHNFDDDRRLEIAPGFHASDTHAGGQSVGSRVFSMDWNFTPVRRVEFIGAFYTGRNVAPLGAGYQQGFGTNYGRLYAVSSMGGWAQLTLHTTRRLDFHLFSGQQDDENRDLITGRIGKNMMFGGNLYYRLAPNVLLGLETSHLRTAYIGQGVRINNHYDLALGYFF